MIKFIKCTKNIFLGRVPVILDSCNLEMTNLRTDEMAFFCTLTKIGTDENKAIYSRRETCQFKCFIASFYLFKVLQGSFQNEY